MKIFYLLLYLFLILSFIYTFEYYSSKYYYSNINLSTINLTTISNSLIIFSCYYDKRFKSIRLIGVSTRKVNIMCKYIVGNKYKSCDYKYISMSKDSSGRNFKSLYINILVHLYYNTTVPNQIIINNKKYNVINVKKREMFYV